jgi:hypothetical protein
MDYMTAMIATIAMMTAMMMMTTTKTTTIEDAPDASTQSATFLLLFLH